VGVDAEHRPLVALGPGTRSLARRSPFTKPLEEDAMARGMLLWMLGVPIPVIILLWLFFGR
jgi:hypothetical protein